MSTLLIGLGHPDRGDDAVGPLIVEACRDLAGVTVLPLVDPVDLPMRWADASSVVVVDAVLTGGEPGAVVVADLLSMASDSPWWSWLGLGGTHAFGLGEAVALSRVLGRLPERLTLIGIEAASVMAGAGLSPAVAAAVPGAIDGIRDLLGRAAVGAGDVSR